jgi:hypothetical protein
VVPLSGTKSGTKSGTAEEDMLCYNLGPLVSYPLRRDGNKLNQGFLYRCGSLCMAE